MKKKLVFNTRLPEEQYDRRNTSHLAAESFKEKTGIYPNTELGVILKLLTQEPGRLEIGSPMGGVITRDDEEHFTFIQNASERKKKPKQRTLFMMEGTCINIKQKSNGALFPTFNRPTFNKDFTLQEFLLKAAQELLSAACLLKEWPASDNC